MSAFIVLLALDVNDRVNEWGHQALLQARAAIARQTLMSRINSWTKQQDELLLRLYPTYRPACIAIFLGRTKGAVMTPLVSSEATKTAALMDGLAKLPPRLSCSALDGSYPIAETQVFNPTRGLES
jgi:hypothetical protein